MIKIPEDVMNAARKQCDLCGITALSDMRVHAEHVAAFAILSERKACVDACRLLADHQTGRGQLQEAFASAFIAGQIEAGIHRGA